MSYLEKINFKLYSSESSRWIYKNRVDIFLVLGLAIAIAISTYSSTYQIPDPVFTDFYAQDVWFGSDIPTVFGNITSINSDFGRNNKHPLFPLIVFPLVFAIINLLQLDSLAAVRLLVTLVAAFWIGSIYILLRTVGCYRLDAVIISLLGMVSAASVFWLAIPETFSFGSITILLGLIFAAIAQYRPFSSIWYVALNVITVSITITNAMVGIFTTVVNHRWKKIILIGNTALLLSTGLWILQRIVFTNSGFPFQLGTFIGEKKFVSTPGSHDFLAFLSAFFYQTMVMPTIQLQEYVGRPDWVQPYVSTLSPASGLLSTIAIISWSGLLLFGVFGFFVTKKHAKLRIVLGLTLTAQLVMHSIYGVGETFIYSLHFIPLLLLLVAFSLFTRLRLVSLVLAVVLLISAGINNRAQFSYVSTALWNYGTPQQKVEAQMRRRPNDPWLRSSGHVILSKPGSSLEHKAFYEPGGSFSPTPGSFGAAVWVVDQQGNVKATSDTLPLSEIQQALIERSPREAPGISTKTPYYEADWIPIEDGSWQLDLKQIANADSRLLLVIRSVGPAGGAIHSLNWNGNSLLINQRWIVSSISGVPEVYLGSENETNWVSQKQDLSQWEDDYGWGYARIELNQGESLNLVLEDSQHEPDGSSAMLERSSNLLLNLPSPFFVQSLNAQVEHLLMGVVGTRTHPTDPISYPFPRFRDGAYQMVALARAGHLNMAQQLAPYFAETDFLNSIVPEADIPALGIWALEEVAALLDQPDYDKWLWPHVRRKAELIMTMASSHRPGYPVLEGAEFPFSEHPDFIQIDVLAGRMDNHPNAFGLNTAANAISYRALMDAASLADRVNQSKDAARWRSQASQIKSVWQESNEVGFSAVANTLWPSRIAADDQAALTKALEQRWDASRNVKGEFNQSPDVLQEAVAEAHQWLLLNQPNRVWPTLQWFWDNQASPGLYTWWGNDAAVKEMPMPQSFSQWHRFRGWINPSQTTPHYWTSAEMLLLQLDMLAYIDQTVSTPTLVIGAGIPQEWINQPMSVQGLLVGHNVINWEWNGSQMKVQIQGEKMDVHMGASFPSGTPLEISMLQKSG